MWIPGFRGPVHRPGTAEYEQLRRIFNRRHDGRRPLAVARPTDAADVAAAVRHARADGLPIAVRGGGHNFAGYAAGADALVLDLREMSELAVEPECLRLTIGAGLTWGQVDAATHPAGYAAVGGSFSTVGAVGFSLGTGLGWLSRAHGLAGDNLLAATVVTADGEIVETSERHEPDLFWALRGGGGNFGAVTRLRTILHPVRPVLAGSMAFPLDSAARVLGAVRDATADAPNQLSWAAVLTPAPDAAAWPDDLRGRPVLLLSVCWSGSGDGVAGIRRAAGPAAVDTVRPMAYRTFQRSSDAAAPPGAHWDVRSEWLSTLDDQAIDDLVAGIAANRAPLSEVLVRPLGGAIAREVDTPFSYRGAGWLLEVLAGWSPDDDAADTHVAWMDRTWRALRRVSAGGPCISHLGVGEGPDRVAAAYGPAALTRLRAVKRHYDPDNLFSAAPPLTTPKLSTA